MNIYDISEAAGVSIASVSRVLNGAANVSEETRKKIQDVIDKMGYTPNLYARGLGRTSLKTIGILCSDSSDIYLANAVYYLETFLRKHGYHTLLCCTGYRLRDRQEALQELQSRQVDAIVMVGSQYVYADKQNNKYIEAASEALPVFLINGEFSCPNVYSFLCDEEGSMREAVSILRQKGKQSFVYLYSSDSTSGKRKMLGFEAGCRALGIPEACRRILKAPKEFYAIRDRLRQSYEAQPFDAVITSSDTGGIGAVKFANALGLRIPEELSILSFNNSALALASNPELSSMDSRLETLCDMAVSGILHVLKDTKEAEEKPAPLPPLQKLPCIFIERGTS